MDNAAYCSNLGYFSAKLLLEGGCGFGCSFSDEGSVLIENLVTAGHDLESTSLFSSPQNVIICPKTGTRLVDAIPCWMDGRNVVTAIVLSS